MEMTQPKCNYCELMGLKPHCHNCSVANEAQTITGHQEIKMSPAELVAYINDEEKMNSREINIGDYFYTTILGENVKVVLIGLNHDKIANSNSYAKATFATFMDDARFLFHSSTDGVGGWSDSKMRTVYMKRFLASMPTVIRKNIKLIEKEQIEMRNSVVEVVKTKDKLFLFSDKELTNKRLAFKDINSNEKQYEFFSEGGQVQELIGNSTAWTRTFRSAGQPQIVYGDGSLSYEYATYTYRCLLGFCI